MTANTPLDDTLRAALEHHRAGRLDQAADGYRAVLRTAPQHAGALNNLGLVLQRTGRLPEALAAFEGAVAAKPDSADAQFNLAVAARAAGQTARAEQAYRAALAHDPRLASAYIELGALLQGQGRLDDAADIYRRALTIRDDYAPVLSNLAVVEHQRGRLDEAIALMGRASAASPDSAPLHTNYGILLQERGDLDAAGVEFARAIALKRDYAPAHTHAGLLAHERGDIPAAIACFETVLDLEPGDEDARYMLAVLRGQKLERAPTGYVARLFDQYAARFDDHLTGALGYRAPADLAALIAAEQPGRAFATVLDIGCGTGLSGLPFRAAAQRLIGVDLSEQMLARAKARGLYDALYRTDAREFLAGFAGTIDLAVVADVLVYVGDAAPLLEALAARLAPGGLVALSIERLETGTFALADTGRFVHNPEHLAEVGAGCGLELLARRDSVIRRERRAPAHGTLMVLRKV